MKFICTQENLKRALSIVERVTSKNTTLPILENILMETKGGLIQLSATNLEIGIVTSFGAKIEEEGKVALPVKIFTDFVANLPQENKIAFSLRDGQVDLESGLYRATIKSFDAQDFPIIPKPSAPRVSVNFLAQELKRELAKTTISISPTATRIEFSGVYMVFDEQEIRAVSTDSFRLSEVKIPCQYTSASGTQDETSLILPHQTLIELLRLLEAGREKVVMDVEEGQVFFLIDDEVFLVSRLINGKFPDYQQIIPKAFECEVMVSKDELQRAVKLANIFSATKTAEVMIDVEVSKKHVVFASGSSQSGSNVSDIACPVEGSDQKILLNPKFILDALGVNTHPSVKIGMNGSASPVVLRWVNQKGTLDDMYKYVLMPIKK